MAPKSAVDASASGAVESDVDTSLRFVRDLDAEPAAVQALFDRLAAEDDAAIAGLYDAERETYFRH